MEAAARDGSSGSSGALRATEPAAARVRAAAGGRAALEVRCQCAPRRRRKGTRATARVAGSSRRSRWMTQSRSPRRRFRHRQPYRNLDAGAAGRQQHLRDNEKENSVIQYERQLLKWQLSKMEKDLRSTRI